MLGRRGSRTSRGAAAANTRSPGENGSRLRKSDPGKRIVSQVPAHLCKAVRPQSFEEQRSVSDAGDRNGGGVAED
jgi:hypothetical protein